MASSDQLSVATRGCALVLLVLCGCATGDGYWQARLGDLTDCARFEVSAAVGLYGEVQLTSAIHGAVGLADASLTPALSIGWDPRPGQPRGRVRSAAFPIMLVGWPIYGKEQTDLGLADTHPYRRSILAPFFLMGNHHVEGEAVSLLGLHRLVPNPLLIEAPSIAALNEKERGSRGAWISFSGTAGVVSIDAGVNPLEIVDLLGGFIGLDPLGDDPQRKFDDGSSIPDVTKERAREKSPPSGRTQG